MGKTYNAKTLFIVYLKFQFLLVCRITSRRDRVSKSRRSYWAAMNSVESKQQAVEAEPAQGAGLWTWPSQATVLPWTVAH